MVTPDTSIMRIMQNGENAFGDVQEGEHSILIRPSHMSNPGYREKLRLLPIFNSL